ncbi:MAG TPA: TPM domain-containing protein [Casimicrobiaceae bacterium]|nr:TPM domain-containing protein [Casimicrobiaceae bacterium]
MNARVAFVVLQLFLAIAAIAADVPYLTGRVVDEAEILSSATRQKLAADLKAHEEHTTNQIAVLTVRTLEGESVEDFAVRVFETWKLGQKGKDNGVLVVIAPADRRMRIEVGYGLEGTLTDAIAARIIRERMTPQFKANNYDAGVTQGVAAIVDTLESRANFASGSQPASAGKAQSFLSFLDSIEVGEFEQDLPPWPIRILLGAFIFSIIGLFTFIGIVTPGMGWFLYLFLIPFWAMFPIVVVGVKGALLILVTYVVGFPIAKLVLRGTGWYAKAAKDLKATGRATMGGMVITSGGSGSFGGSSSSGSSGGGFSGGGGSSGGGGASGSW